MSHRNSFWATALATTMLAVSACAGAPTDRTAGQVVDDVTLTGRVKAALVESPQTKARDIDVEVRKGEVQLNGFVDSADQSAHAVKLAMEVEGVKSVRNNLQVQSQSRTGGQVIDDAAITAKVKTALIGDMRTKAHQIEVTTNRGEVQLGGFVDSMAAKQAASEIAGAVAGVKSVDNGLEVKR